jgi:hypothetical protein
VARVLRALPLVGILVGASLCFTGVSSASTVEDGYNISVTPTTQTAGDPVTVTGNGQVDSGGGSDNCDSTDITVTVTYFTLADTQTTAQTDLGTSDGDGDLSGPVTIPAAAAPTSFSGQPAAVQASCDVGDNTFLSNVVDVTVAGTVPTTTTPTTVPTTPTTTATAAPIRTAPAATPVTGTPQFTG